MMAVMTLITKMKTRVMTPKMIIQDLGGATVVARVVTPATMTIQAAMMMVVVVVVVVVIVAAMMMMVVTPATMTIRAAMTAVVMRVMTLAITTIRAAMMAAVTTIQAAMMAVVTTIRAAAVATPAQAATTLAKVITMMIKDLGQKLAINFLKPGRCDCQAKGVLDDLASLTAGGPVLVSI